MPPDNQQQPAAPPPVATGGNTPAPTPGPTSAQTPQSQTAAIAAVAAHEKEKATEKAVAQNTTQSSLLISEVRDNMVIMADGSFRAVVACKSINFDLMSSREREGVEFSYQNLLNALNFSVQIFIRSQRVDIGPYLDRLATIRRSQDNMLLNVLMDDYIDFIEVLSEEANIMDKSFFVVIPYYPTGDLNQVVAQGKGFFSKVFGSNKTFVAKKIDKVAYAKAKDELKKRIDSLTGSLFELGIKNVQLNTKELAELYYNVYNPDTAVREPLGDFEKVTSTYVRKGQGEAPRPHLQEGVM